MYIDEDTGVTFQDEGQWRSWQLYAIGVTLEELLESARISEVDQDGGEISTYDLANAKPEVLVAAYSIIEQTIGENYARKKSNT